MTRTHLQLGADLIVWHLRRLDFPALPDVDEIARRFRCSRATAYRYRNFLDVTVCRLDLEQEGLRRNRVQRFSTVLQVKTHAPPAPVDATARPPSGPGHHFP